MTHADAGARPPHPPSPPASTGSAAGPGTLSALETPVLLLDKPRLEANLARMNARAAALSVALRPHMKTLKVRELLPLVLDAARPRITVSTLKEADFYADAGVRDILYTVAITPNKLAHAIALARRGIGLTLVVDSLAATEAVIEAARLGGVTMPVMIEVDTDGHRAGLKPDDPLIVAIGRRLDQTPAATVLRGVMAHAGESYGCETLAAVAAMAERERVGAVSAALALRDAGVACPEVSVGSTPTALYAEHLNGVTELRAGVYMSFDLVMAGIGVCAVDDIALSVLTTVVGHRADRGWILVDAGFLALSRDRGTAAQRVDQGYGLVCDEAGRLLSGLLVSRTYQEHGLVEARDRSIDLARFPIGSRLRILPNHACATAAQHDHMLVVSGSCPLERWNRVNGWTT